MKNNWEVNPYKKIATFASFFCVHSSIKVSITFFLFPTNILPNKVKQVCYKIIFINSLFIIYYDFLKIFNIVRNLKKKCGHHEKSCELKQLLFLRVYLSGFVKSAYTMSSLGVHHSGINKLLIRSFRCYCQKKAP